MARLSEWRSERFPEEGYGLTTTRGLLAGLFQSFLHLVGFAALFALALLLDVANPAAWPEDPSTIAFWASVLGSGAVGAGMVYLATAERVARFWRTLRGRSVTILAMYACLWLFFSTASLYAFFAAVAFLLGRVLAHVWFYAAARV